MYFEKYQLYGFTKGTKEQRAQRIFLNFIGPTEPNGL